MIRHIYERIFSTFLFVLIVFGNLLQVFAQPESEACKALPQMNDDFVLIDDVKSRTQKEVGELESKIKDYKEVKIPKFEKIERELERVNAEIADLSKRLSKNDQETLRLTSLAKEKGSIEDLMEGKSSQSLKDELKQFEDDHSWKVEQLRCINSTLSQMLSPLQKFKFWMSAFFAGLILIVIGGFFVIAYKDENVRRAIFGGQSGLQFLTLFSIVIAIILFGITNILEGRELAALLGGLSGYILGKYSAPELSSAGNSGVVAHVIITPNDVRLTANNKTQQITASASDAQSNSIPGLSSKSFQWRSSDSTVASVNQDGLVTYLGVGTCIVTAELNGLRSNNCAVTCT